MSQGIQEGFDKLYRHLTAEFFSSLAKGDEWTTTVHTQYHLMSKEKSSQSARKVGEDNAIPVEEIKDSLQHHGNNGLSHHCVRPTFDVTISSTWDQIKGEVDAVDGKIVDVDEDCSE